MTSTFRAPLAEAGIEGKNSMGGGAPACGRYQVQRRRTLRWRRPRSVNHEKERALRPRALIRETSKEQRPGEVRSHVVGETAACKKRPASRVKLQGRSKFKTGTNRFDGQGLLQGRSLRVTPARSGGWNCRSAKEEHRKERMTTQEQK
jgi:hypothetical protein